MKKVIVLGMFLGALMFVSQSWAEGFSKFAFSEHVPVTEYRMLVCADSCTGCMDQGNGCCIDVCVGCASGQVYCLQCCTGDKYCTRVRC